MWEELLLTAVVAAPGLTSLLLGLAWLAGFTPGERTVARITGVVSTLVAAGSALLAWSMVSTGGFSVRTPSVTWFELGRQQFRLVLFVDRLSLPLVLMTAVLVGLVGLFSVRYLHRERGFFRFFLLLHLFSFGALLVFTAGTLDLLLGGWELVGITSVLLVAFFDYRREPVRNALRVFAFYRVADIGLLCAILLSHSLTGTSQMDRLFGGPWPAGQSPLSGGQALVVALLLMTAACGKSAQVPFSGWLPRAMEGPTPSSAIFYGAISVHLGAYLLLRSRPLLEAAPLAAAAVVAVGGATSLLATLVHRASTDAKTSLAYAGMAQVGLIFVEIGLGFPRLAVLHLVGHAVVRTLQFLRAPSMLRDFSHRRAAAGGEMALTGLHFEWLLPQAFRAWLYRAAIERGYHDALVDRWITAPMLRLARWCESHEPGFLARPASPQPLLLAPDPAAERAKP